MLSVTEAQNRLLGHFVPLTDEIFSVNKATGRVLACDIQAGIDIPLFNNSSMDGFAIRSEDVILTDRNNPAILQVVADVPAGKEWHGVLQIHQAVRIMTGGKIPEGADAVVPVEETDFNERQPGIHFPDKVKIFQAVKAGEYVRMRGQDIQAGDTVLKQGHRVRPQDIGLMSMLGMAKAQVYCKPRIAVFSTGDELLEADVPLTAGKLYDANTNLLVSLVEQSGAMAVSLGIVPDQEEEIKASLDRAATLGVDLIISSAGVSVGAFDFVRTVVEQHGGMDFWQVNMKPGKPLVFGYFRGIPLIGLPGNPVSAFVGFEVFVRPAIYKFAGIKSWLRPTTTVRLVEQVISDGRESYMRAIVWSEDNELKARLVGHQGSGNLRSLVEANALLIIPSGVKSCSPGTEINAWMIDGLI